MKILITGGGTTQKIDEMRTITNKSTGRTSILLAEGLNLNAKVTLLLAENVHYQNTNINIHRFTDVTSLKEKLLSFKEQAFDLIIHAAAVSDYELKEVLSGGNILKHDKIPSGLNELVLKLAPTEKIINSLKNIWPKAKLIGFKLTSGANQEEIFKGVSRVIKDGNLDFIIHNDLKQRRLGNDSFTIFDATLNQKHVDTISDLIISIKQNLINPKDVFYDSLS